MMKKIKISLLFAFTFLIATLSSCNSSSDEPQSMLFSAFSTLESLDGSSCSFSIQEDSDSSPIILTASISLNSQEFKVGGRYVIQYSTLDNNPFTPGPITLYAVVSPFTGNVTEASKSEINNLTSDPISIFYINRTSNWINIQAVASVTNKPEAFGLYVDETTLGDEYPKVYVGFKSDNISSINQNQFFGSFNVQSLFELPTAKGFTLYYRYNGSQNSVKFEKPSKDFSPKN